MSDFYTEQLIKKRKTGKDLVIQILLRSEEHTSELQSLYS